MTDIVERLRVQARGGYAYGWRELAVEAADEIERLRQTAIETMQEMLRRANEIAKWREENERLTADLAVAQANLSQKPTSNDEAKWDTPRPGAKAMTDNVERLHVVRDQLRTGRFGQREVWEEWLEEAATEIEWLREVVAAAAPKP